MNASSWFRQAACVALVLGVLCLVRDGMGQDKAKAPPPGKEPDKPNVIQIDLNKLPPDVVKRILELSKAPAKGDAKQQPPAASTDQTNQGDGQHNNKDDGAQNNKDDGDQNNKDDGQKNNKEASPNPKSEAK